MRAARLTLLLLLPALLAGSASAYPWPVKPFDQQHPIRGYFGDPRVVYLNGVLSGPFDGPGFFGFHQGIDIAADDGTPVYAVADGRAHYVGAATLNIDAGNERVFQYFHIVPIVGEGQNVIARRTILGYVQPPFGHVHLTEIVGIRSVDPLRVGHLEPFSDRMRPTIRDFVIRNQAGDVQTPLGLCGRVQLAVDAFDMPPTPVPGKFNGLPVAPAIVRWKIVRLSGADVFPWRIAADFRVNVPPNSRFGDVYAKGTYENAPRFGNQQYAEMPGRYLYVLASNFDTTTLANGVYVMTIKVGDVRGNSTTRRDRFSVLNARTGACPGTLAAPPTAEALPSEPPAGASP